MFVYKTAYSSSLNRATNYPMHAPIYPQHSPQQMASNRQPIYPNQSNPRIQNVIPSNRPNTPGFNLVTCGGFFIYMVIVLWQLPRILANLIILHQ